MMKDIVKVMFFAVVLSVFSGQGRAAGFIDGFEDIPMPAGMHQMPNDNLSFGNEESRLVEAYLTGGKSSFKAIEEFYLDTLPQLGWHFRGKAGNSLSFDRDGERLDVVRESVLPLVVRITVKSQN